MAVPTQYDVEHQVNGEDEEAGVVTQRTVPFKELRRKFEEARIMYLPRDLTLLKEGKQVQRRVKRCHSTGPLKSRPRSAAYDEREIDTPSPLRRTDSLRSLPLCEYHSSPRRRDVLVRNLESEKPRRPQEVSRWSMGCGARRSVDSYSPTRRTLPGVKRNSSPRSINRAAGSSDWPDGIFTKTGDVYKRISNNGISYIIPVSPDGARQAHTMDYRRSQLTVDCSDPYAERSPSPQVKERPNPCLNYSYLEYANAGTLKPYRSATLSDWTGIGRTRKSASCQSLNQPDVFRVKRYSVPRAANGDDDVWKIRAQEIGGGRRRVHAVRGSWSPVQFYPSPRSTPGDREEATEREVRERVAIREQCRSYPRHETPQTSPVPHHLTPDGIDESSISRAFGHNIAHFEKLAVDNKQEALCTKCSRCWIHSPAARQSYHSRRLFSTRRTPNRRGSVNGELNDVHYNKYRFNQSGYDHQPYSLTPRPDSDFFDY